jgi:hypothetical protein
MRSWPVFLNAWWVVEIGKPYSFNWKELNNKEISEPIDRMFSVFFPHARKILFPLFRTWFIFPWMMLWLFVAYSMINIRVSLFMEHMIEFEPFNKFPIDILVSWLVLTTIVLWFMLSLRLLRFIYQSFNPLYAFGNLGEKIQKLTPQIATQSKAIEQNFASDMNFRVLSDGFDGLASTFSQIVSLVIRLEKTEQKANKGNLFDSTKYIGSLRSDIVWPLRSLRNFLNDKKTELMTSQQELSRVRVQVGGMSEQRDLASARTEPLMRELTENIDALNVMIEKMG